MARLNPDCASPVREFEGVPHQVVQHLVQSSRITNQFWQLTFWAALNLSAFGLVKWRTQKVSWHDCQFDAPCLGLRLEDRLNHLEDTVGVEDLVSEREDPLADLA